MLSYVLTSISGKIQLAFDLVLADASCEKVQTRDLEFRSWGQIGFEYQLTGILGLAHHNGLGNFGKLVNGAR